jgi:hypothetical protein
LNGEETAMKFMLFVLPTVPDRPPRGGPGVMLV